MANSYVTTSRKNILEFLQSNSNRTVTVSDIDAYLKTQGQEVNITTIYRYLDRLSGDGIVLKYVAEKGKHAAYQYVEQDHHCEEHLHLTCTSCGTILHLECEFMNEIAHHIEQDHGFQIQCKKSMIYGICQKCRSHS